MGVSMRFVAGSLSTRAQDSLAVLIGMVVAILFALNFDLFREADSLTPTEIEITALEAIGLIVLLAAALVIFLWRGRHSRSMEAIGKEELNQLRIQASQDPLTGLANRRTFASMLQQAADEDRQVAVLLLDIDGFKQLNDTFGHVYGDTVLQVVAKRLRSAARPEDLVARLGGDEFAVIVWDVDHAMCLEIGRRIIDALEADVVTNGRRHRVHVSVGAALLPSDCDSPSGLLQKADRAMYQAKATRATNFMLYNPNENTNRQLKLA